MLSADGTPLKKSLQIALRRQKLRALALVAPLLLFVLISFIAPIADMLFRSVENEIVSETIPRTVIALESGTTRTAMPPRRAKTFTPHSTSICRRQKNSRPIRGLVPA
jgi:putative spermidine/putrescine transport system permease protein